ncbi:signal peptide protein [Kitasatospora sp. NPDC056651]|uniref:signal peptide protein n=1 Tax=Kitasatospora sp. NPDC056651 TaxID=3345892 RepID=UPI0036C63B04
MRTRNIPRRSLALAAALAALPTAALATPAVAAPPNELISRFVELPRSPLPSDHGQRTITVTYRNDSARDRTVAPQILVESPASGPFLDPASIRLEVLGPDGHWRSTALASQTGTLYTRLDTVQLVLHGHGTLTEQYRLTVVGKAPLQGTIEPRVAIYR